MEHVFSGWHVYMQSFSLACAGETEGKGSKERKEGGGKKKIDMDVNRLTHRKTDRLLNAFSV